MSDERAERAIVEHYRSDPKAPNHHYYRRGFLVGFDTATAECEATVREAVKATIEEAATTVENYDNEHLQTTCDYIAESVRALDVSAIVRRVMASKEN